MGAGWSRLIPIAVFLAACLCACTDQQRYEGRYVNETALDTPIVLTLKAGGEGAWDTGLDTAAFRWKIRGKEIWLHTRTGGVVLGSVLGPEDLAIDIPGVGLIHFQRMGE